MTQCLDRLKYFLLNQKLTQPKNFEVTCHVVQKCMRVASYNDVQFGHGLR